MELIAEQKHAIKGLVKDLDVIQVNTCGGLAGTGKTTVIKYLIKVLQAKGLSFAVIAFTGKATNVLRKKNLSANTIHSTIYQPHKDNLGQTVWCLVDKYHLASQGIDGFIVDEGSMVSAEIHEDLMSFGLPIIYFGDHGQLEAIGTKLNLMRDPRYKLETIHRNAGEIAFFAEHLRKGNSALTFKTQNKVQIVKASAIEPKHLASVDQVICAFNKTRVELNEKVRIEKKIQYSFLAKDEKVICLRNSKEEGLFNGMQGVVAKIKRNDRFDFYSDGLLLEDILYDPDQFGKKENEFEFSQEGNPFDYAYAITAHKSQGDEFGSVIAYEQYCSAWDLNRWNYTVASRAKDSLIWVTNKC